MKNHKFNKRIRYPLKAIPRSVKKYSIFSFKCTINLKYEYIPNYVGKNLINE